MAATLCSENDVIMKQGSGVSASGANTTHITDWIEQAEGYVCARSRYDYVTNYASLSTNCKEILKVAVSNLAAMWSIQFDMSGYASRVEAETMLDVLRDGFVKAMESLENDQTKTFLGVSS